MKELYLSKVQNDLGEEIDRYIHIAENLLPKNENTAIYAAFIRNMINGFGCDDDEITESIQLNVYEDIDNIVRDVNEWLESFDSKKIISKLPSLINEYRDGDFNEIVKAEIEKIEKATEAKEEVKEETKDENKVEEATKEAKEEAAGVENNKIPQIIKKYEDEIKNKFSGIDATSVDTLVKSFKDKDEKVINDFESFIRKAADDIINVLKDNLIIDKKFIKDICTQLNIECTDKEIEELLQIVSGVLSETSSKLETTLKNGVNKMIDAIIALIRKKVEESKEEKTEKPKEETEKPKEETETKEREMEKDTKGKTTKTEKNKEEKTTQQVEISADVDNTNVKKFANIINMNIKDYTDIYASFKDDQQKYMNLLRAFKAGDRTYVEEHIKLGDNKMTITDYNELIVINKKITSTKSKRASKKETQPQQ